MEPKPHLLSIAEKNHGLVARHHLTARNADRQRWKRMRRSTSWEPLTDRVLRLRGSAPTVDQHVAAAVLDVGEAAALYGASAAAHWEIAGFVHSVRSPVHVLRPESSKRLHSELAIVHTTVRYAERSIRVLRGIAVTSPVQTILDLARDLPVPRLEAVIDRALQKRIVTSAQIHDAVELVARSGRDGVVGLREALELRPPGYIPPESNLENRLEFLLRRAGIHEFRRQVNVGDDDWVGRVDYRHRHLPVILEVNSEAYHAALIDQVADGDRYERLQRMGYVVVPVWDSDIWYRPEGVVEQVADAVALARGLAA